MPFLSTTPDLRRAGRASLAAALLLLVAHLPARADTQNSLTTQPCTLERSIDVPGQVVTCDVHEGPFKGWQFLGFVSGPNNIHFLTGSSPGLFRAIIRLSDLGWDSNGHGDQILRGGDTLEIAGLPESPDTFLHPPPS